MPDKGLHVQQNENVDRGRLQVNVTSTLGLQPVVNARVGIAYTGESQRLLEELETESSGQTEAVTLDAPPVEYSQEPDRPQPFSEYTVTVQAEGYRSVEVSAIDVFANVTALQEIRMEPLDISQKEGTENIVVPPNTLWGDFPPKIPDRRQIPGHRITMFATGIISKMWHPARSIPLGRRQRCGLIFWQLCLFP